MTIRKLTLSTIAFAVALFIAAQWFVLSVVVMQSFQEVEAEDVERNVARVEDALQNRLEAIEDSLFTWSQWDDSFRFIAGNNPGFVKDNIASTVFTGMKINYFVMLDPDLGVVLEKGFDLAQKREALVPPSLKARLTQESHLFAIRDPSQSVKGLLLLPEGPLMTVAAPITDTQGTKAPNGYVLFARYLDAPEIAHLGRDTHLDVSLHPLSASPDRIVVHPKSDSLIQGLTALKDLEGKPVLDLSVQMPRRVHQQARITHYFLLVCIVVVGLALGAIFLVLLELTVIRRLLRLGREVESVTRTRDFDHQVPSSGNDEIGRLGQHINLMLHTLGQGDHASPSAPADHAANR